MSTSQLLLNAVLFTLIYAVALELRVDDFIGVARRPVPVLAGLVAQFLLLPVVTFLATLLLRLPANIEAGMLLVAACPCGSLSNYVTHYARGNTALSLSITAVANVLALVLTPTNFAWMMAANPATAAWLREIDLDPSLIWMNLAFVLALPLTLGLLTRALAPGLADTLRGPLGRFAVLALFAFVVIALVRDSHLLSMAVVGLFGVVVVHNAAGLALGYGTARLAKLSDLDRRALTFETGMQNSGLALAIVGTRFDADVGMVIVAGLWGTWHIVSGFGLARYWRGRSSRCLIPE